MPLPDAGPRAGSPGGPSIAVAARRGRGRRPSAEVRADILDAAGRILLADGVAGLTVDRIAAVAGVSKMSIYKWWPSRGVLAIESYAKVVEAALSVPDTGDLETDLVAHLTSFVGVLSETRGGRVTAELLGSAQADPVLADAFRTAYLEPRRAVGIIRLAAARDRGQIRDDVDLDIVSDQLWGACMYRLMTGLHPLDPRFVDSLVRNVIDGIGVSTPAEPPHAAAGA